MKKIIKVVVIMSSVLFNNVKANAQITYEHTYTLGITGGQEAPFITDLGNNNYKWVLYNYFIDEFSLYNIDHTPYMLNIPLGFSTDSGHVYTIGYITSTLFDCDSTNIEYAIMAFAPRDTIKFAVYRTDGTLIFEKDSVTIGYAIGVNNGSVEIHGIVNTNAGAKMTLFSQYNDFFVYALCGTLPVNITEIDQSSSYVRVSPVPASNQVNFNVLSPSNMEEYELIIFDSEFRSIQKTSVSGKRNEININTENISSGTYYYSLQNYNKVFQTGKFIILK